MKLDRENSKKNKMIKDLSLTEEKLRKVETSKGVVTFTSALGLAGIFGGVLNAISMIASADLNFALCILDFLIITLSSAVLDHSVIKLNDRIKQVRELQAKRNELTQMIEKDDALEIQCEEISKILYKK